MGHSVTWCAIREERAAESFEQLGLSLTTQTEEFPESPVTSARLDTGWRIIWFNEYGFLKPSDLARLSSDQDVVLCLVEEHVMASSAEFWSHGKRQWLISHDGEDGPKGLMTDGKLPESFPAIRKEMEQEQLGAGGDQAEVDYIFEIPLKVAQSLVGFKHDEDFDRLADRDFVVMSSERTPARGFLARIFGR